MSFAFKENKIKYISLFLPRSYISAQMPPTFCFLLLLADLRCLLRLCLCPELSLLHCLMIDLQYSCLMPPHSPGQLPEWQQLRCFFMINPGGDLLPLNRSRCSHREKNVSLSHCVENIYMMKLALKISQI